jgi:hypothetical protein
VDNKFEFLTSGFRAWTTQSLTQAYITAAMINARGRAQYRVVAKTTDSAHKLYEETLDLHHEYTIFDQRDPRWADVKVGFSTRYTMGGYGCLVTCVAMMVTHHLGIEVTPPMANDKLKEVGGFTGANMYWAKVCEAWPFLSKAGHWRYPYPKNGRPERIDTALDAEHYVIMEVDMVPATARADQHFVLVKDKLGDGVYSILDPWHAGEFEFPPAYCRAGWKAEHGIFQLTVYSAAEG